MMNRKLKTMPAGHATQLRGVCSGVAYWLGTSTTMVRVVWFLSLFIDGGFSLIVYIACAWILDEWDEVPEDYDEITS